MTRQGERGRNTQEMSHSQKHDRQFNKQTRFANKKGISQNFKCSKGFIPSKVTKN